MTDDLTIAGLRKELDLTLSEFGARIGLASKSQTHEVERTGRCSVRVALAIEALSAGRIDAGGLNDDVKASREALSGLPIDTAGDIGGIVLPSPGKGGEISARVSA